GRPRPSGGGADPARHTMAVAWAMTPPDPVTGTDLPGAVATVAGGCFWCTEAVFEQVDGILAVESGYIGGHRPQPTYQQVCHGDTGHAEAVRLRFDPQVLP